MILVAYEIRQNSDLAEAEIDKLSTWLTVIMNQYMLTFSMHERNLGYNYEDMDNGPEMELVWGFESYFGTRFGRVWYMENRHWIVNWKRHRPNRASVTLNE